jgi:MFS family permease
MFEINQVYP